MCVCVVGSNLVEKESSEADAELGGDDGEASFGPSVLSDGAKKPQKELISTSRVFISAAEGPLRHSTTIK